MNNFHQSMRELFEEALRAKVITHQELVYACCQVARSVLPLIKKKKEKKLALAAIEAAERWAANPSIENAATAATAANSAAYAAMTATDAYAALNAAALNAAAFAADTATAAAADTAAFAVDTTANVDDQQNIRQLFLQHLPRLQKMKVWL